VKKSLIVKEFGQVAKPIGSVIPKPGAGSDVNTASFGGGTVEEVEDVFGIAVPDNAIAEMVQLRSPEVHRQVIGGRESYYRRKSGWFATPGGVTILTVDQRLEPQPNGKMKPVGAWGEPVVKTYTPVGQVARRTGSVRADVQTPAGTAPDANTARSTPDREDANESAAAGKAVEKKFADALSFVSYLPAPVRQSIAARARDPHTFQALLIGHYNDSDGVKRYTHYTVRALKMDDNEAIVVQAANQAGSQTWQVEQVVYKFTDAGRAVGDGGAKARSRITS